MKIFKQIEDEICEKVVENIHHTDNTIKYLSGKTLRPDIEFLNFRLEISFSFEIDFNNSRPTKGV